VCVQNLTQLRGGRVSWWLKGKRRRQGKVYVLEGGGLRHRVVGDTEAGEGGTKWGKRAEAYVNYREKWENEGVGGTVLGLYDPAERRELKEVVVLEGGFEDTRKRGGCWPVSDGEKLEVKERGGRRRCDKKVR